MSSNTSDRVRSFPSKSSTALADKAKVAALIKGKSILITGGTGSFGKKCAEVLLRDYSPQKVIVFSRDELKQHDMRNDGFDDPRMRFFIGDIRDCERLKRAMNGVDIVIHAAALKQVPACEYNPMEAIATNILGTRNVIEAALDASVTRVLALSTDKAVNPINLYGATKLCAEKLIIQSNAYAAAKPIRFACVRYGNVVASRGSVIPVFLKQREQGELTITDPRMSRFWLTLEQGVAFVLDCLANMTGGEVFVPKIPSMSVVELAKTLAPECKTKIIGIRPGEKIHEVLIGEDEAAQAKDMGDRFVIEPLAPSWSGSEPRSAPLLGAGKSYSSENNDWWLTGTELRDLLAEPGEATQSVPSKVRKSANSR